MEARAKGGLASLLLALAMIAAFLSVTSSASAATVFCKEFVETCPKESVYPISTNYSASVEAGKVTLITSQFSKKQCTGSAFEWTTTETTEEGTLVGSVGKVTFSGCSGGCTVEARNLPWKVEFRRETEFNAMEVSNSGAGPPGLRILCGGVKCTYAAESSSSWTVHQVSEEEAAHVWGQPFLALIEGFACENAIQWDVDYLLNSPEPAYLTLG